MSESAKTGLFIILAVVALLVTWTARPATPGRTVLDDSGQRFFDEFDPLQATSLEIIEFDEATASPQAFKVAQQNGVWSIPSHESYPADADKQLAEAAASVVDLIKGTNVSDRPADHGLYGVIDPTETAAGSTGVGTRITLEDRTGRTLADFIIGTTVKDKPELRYVRVPGRDRVYTTAVNTDKLSTRFEDWIEKDLLQMDTGELLEVSINDYSIDELNQRIIPGDRFDLVYDDDEGEWSLSDLADDEEIADDRLDDLKDALDELEIIDVHRKPAGLSAELRAEDQLVLDAEAVRSLQNRGYYIVNGQLLSNQGQTVISMSNGVRYVLRFGEIAVGQRRRDDSSGSEGEGDVPPTGANRYLFVTAEFHADLVQAPQLVEFPKGPAATEADDASVEEDMAEARRTVEDENQRKQEQYQQKLDAGRQIVKKLNDRFADWYYVISDRVYNKIRLKRSDVVTNINAEAGDITTTPPGGP